MKNLEGKKTYSWLAFLAATQFPELSNPLWATLADTGMSLKVVATLKVASFLLGAAGVAYGRWKAKT